MNSNITIPCPCGNKYDSPKGRFHTCPKCLHVWDLRPDIPKNQKIPVGPMKMQHQTKQDVKSILERATNV